jgi:hypothetical protein
MSRQPLDETVWAAGLYEGEGCVTLCRGRLRLQLKMVTRASVERFQAALGVGKVYGPYGPYASQLGSQPTYLYVAEGEDFDIAVERLAPHLTKWARERIYETSFKRGNGCPENEGIDT